MPGLLQRTDYIDFSKYHYSDINNVFRKILQIADNSMNILTGLTESLVSDEEYVVILVRDEKGDVLEKRIPSLYHYTDAVLNLKDTLKQLKTEKILEYNEIELNNARIFVEPDNISVLPSLDVNSIQLNENPIFAKFWEKYFNITIDISKSVDLLSKLLKVKTYSIRFDDITEDNLYSLLQQQSEFEFLEYCRNNQIYWSKQEKLYNLDTIQTEEAGEFVVETIIKPVSQTIVGENQTFWRIVKLNHRNVKTRYIDKPFETRSLAVGDFLVKNTTNKYKIIDIKETAEGYEYTLESDINALAIQEGDVLHIESRLLDYRNFKYEIDPVSLQVLFFKSVSPNLNIESDKWTVKPLFVNPKELIVSDDLGVSLSIFDYATKLLYDYTEHFESLKKEMSIPLHASIIPDTPVLNINNFKVIRVDSNKLNSNDPELNKLLQEFTFNTQRINQLEDAITKVNEQENELKMQGFNDDSPEMQELFNERDYLHRTLAETEAIYKKLKQDIKGLNYDIPETIEAKYEIMGAWEFPEPKVDLKGRIQDVIQFEIEYAHLDTRRNQQCTPGLNFTKLDNHTLKVLFPRPKRYLTDIRPKVVDSVTGRYVWEYPNSNLENSIPTINKLNIEIMPFEVVQIRIRAISEAGYPVKVENKNISEWSNSIFIEFPNEYQNIETVERTQQTIINQIVSESQNETINSLTRKLQEMERKFTEQIGYLKNEIVNQYPIIEHFPYSVVVQNTPYHYKVVNNLSSEGNIFVINSTKGKVLMQERDYRFDYSMNVLYFSDDYTTSIDVNDKHILIAF